MKYTTGHFEQARRVAERWRQDGCNHVLVVREGGRARRCYPCRQRGVPVSAVAGWDYYPLPTLDRPGEGAPAGRSVSRAELWNAAAIL